MHALPSVSVITVTYNLIEAGRQESIRRAIDSVRDQDGDGIEHVIQDGASTDGTQELIAGIVNANPMVRFASEPDRGLYDAMNRGVERATGDYVLFLNSDDALASSDILQHMRMAMSHHRPDFCYGGTANRDADGNEHVALRTSLKAVLQRMPFCHNSVLIRRSVFRDLGGHDTDYAVAADYDLVLRMVAAGFRGLRIDRPVSLFWSRGVSADDDRVALDYARIWKRFFRDYPAAQGLSVEDFQRFYHRGHMPVSLMLEALRRNGSNPAIRSAASHGLFKSLRRSLQPWRQFGGTAG